MRRAKVFPVLVAAILMIGASAFTADIGSVVNNPPEQDNFKIIGINDLAKLIANPRSEVRAVARACATIAAISVTVARSGAGQAARRPSYSDGVSRGEGSGTARSSPAMVATV